MFVFLALFVIELSKGREEIAVGGREKREKEKMDDAKLGAHGEGREKSYFLSFGYLQASAFF